MPRRYPFTVTSVLAITDWYLPGTKGGGPVRSLMRLVETLGSEVSFYFVARDHDIGDRGRYVGINLDGWSKCGSAQVHYVSRRLPVALQLARIARSIDYDAVYLNSVFSSLSRAYLLLRRLRLIRDRPVIVAPRGELAARALALKGRRKRAYLWVANLIGLFDDVVWSVSTSFEEGDVRALLQSDARAGPNLSIRVVPNIVPLPDEYRSPRTPKEAGTIRIVFLSRIDRKKNLDGALRLMQGAEGHVTFDVYGPCSDVRYLEECKELVSHMPPNVLVRFLGELPSERVPHTIREYDLFFLPTLNENFGHVIVEALAAGCPVLISDQTAWRGLEHEGAGWDVALRDAKQFAHIISLVTRMDSAELEKWRVGAWRYASRAVLQQQAVTANRELFHHVGRASAVPRVIEG